MDFSAVHMLQIVDLRTLVLHYSSSINRLSEDVYVLRVCACVLCIICCVLCVAWYMSRVAFLMSRFLCVV